MRSMLAWEAKPQSNWAKARAIGSQRTGHRRYSSGTGGFLGGRSVRGVQGIARRGDETAGVATTVLEVRDDQRVHEIARMLSGSESEASLDHARELLKDSAL